MVIAIIAVLVSLLLPAVQQAREAARRSTCRNNLKQLGLALHNYHDAYTRFPPSCITNHTGTVCAGYGGPNISGLTLLLPYLELAVLYNRYDFSLGQNLGANTITTHGRHLNEPVASTEIPGFQCPSDPNFLVQTTGGCMRSANTNPDRYHSSGGTNYLFCAGWGPMSWIAIPSDGTGKHMIGVNGIFARNGSCSVRDIVDGASNTLAMGEVLWVDHNSNAVTGNGGAGGKPSWAVGIGTQINFSTNGGINGNFLHKGPNTTDNGTGNNPARAAALQSDHIGGAMLLLADGSVRFVSENVSQDTLNSAATRADGDIPGEY
ncbi:DUF1559 domain-containing protein [Planctomicrobium sp. SH664]|uniref:DUF1559 domain-containing protein n=1 Tax=Planctomicrobium sp. SH664 TaxID=3448125 RepID=UPI003F5C5C30